MLSVILTILCGYTATGAEVRLGSANDLIQFSNNVNAGTTYAGTTVFLDSDIDLSGRTLDPIGCSGSLVGTGYGLNYKFCGVFDGQGHVISNLVINPSQCTGLFGRSSGLTIRNVILDSSCSISSSYRVGGSYYNYVGGFLGYCHGYNGHCTIENSVNMGSVSFSGSTEAELHLGGIAGDLSVHDNSEPTVKNCANYGPVTHSGTSDQADVGGIVGHIYSYSPDLMIHVYNSLNYGSVTHDGTTEIIRFGGIAGYSRYGDIENCLSAGKITLAGSIARHKFFGSLTGSITSESKAINTYFTSDVGANTLYGQDPPDNTTGSPSYSSAESTAVSSLNTQASNNGWNKWLLNTNSAAVTFKVNNNKGFSVSKKVILLPNLSPTGSYSFVGWYKDVGCSELFQSTSVTSTTTLYGLYGTIYTVTFNPNGGSVSPTTKGIAYDSTYGTLPTPTRTGYKFDGWFTAASGGTEIKSNTKVTTTTSQTLYAHWTANSYKVTFDKNGGDSVSKTSATVTYGSTYGTLPTATRAGYTLAGWYTAASGGTVVKSNTKMTTAKDHSIYARWTANKYNITFEINEGDTVSKTTITVAYDGTYGALPTAEKTGYTFDGWFTEEEGGDKIEPTTKVNVTGTQTLYAHWTANTYTITFNTTTADGDVLQQPSQEGTYDLEYGTLPEPERTGYTFAGWFTEEDGQGERITEDTNVTIAANHTLYGHWNINNYTIRFEYGNGADAEERVLDFNAPINYTEDLVREGYTFAGWDMKPDTVPAQDLTISALWTPNNYTLSFDGCGGEGVGNESELEVVYDDFYGSLPEPTKTGYTFAGWFTEEGGEGDKVETGGQVKVTRDVTLHAHWSINQYTITFEVDGGSECENIIQDYNTEVVLPEPTKTGYTFDCWCSDPELSREYTETTMPAGDVTLYAKWSINRYSITFIFNNGAENEVRTLDFNEEIDYPENAEKTGYTFSGWDNEPDRMPAENITVTALWTAVEKPTKPEDPEKPEKPEKPSETVEVVFGKDFTEEEVEDILRNYTKDGFVIVGFERDEKTGETRVIVKFSDSKKSEEFVENISENGKEDHFIRDTNLVSGKDSFSSALSPLSLFVSIMLSLF